MIPQSDPKPMIQPRLAADSLACIGAFVAVVEAGSFTQAAERIGVSKSAVGKTIARLERGLGVKLIRRTTRRLQLTLDGELYYQACSLALETLATAEAQIAPYDSVLRGRVHIEMPMAFGKSVLLPLLLQMAAPHPELRLTMSFSDATADLRNHPADLAVRFGPLADSRHLVARRLSSQQRVICASPGYLHARGIPTRLADLNLHQCIVGTVNGPPRQWTVQEGGKVMRVTPPATHQLSDGEAIVAAAVAGFGLCQMPASLLRSNIDQGQLQPVLQNFSGVPVDIHLVWVRQLRLVPRVRYVIDQLIAHAQRGALD